MSHSKIADAAVIGVDDQSAGELPKAFIVKKLSSLSAEEIDAYMKGVSCISRGFIALQIT